MSASDRTARLRAAAARPREVVDEIRRRLGTLDRRVEALEQEVVIAREQQAAELARLCEVLGAVRADESALRDRLATLRSRPDHDDAFTLRRPLVSIVVVGNGPAVAAALAQDHELVEVVVVTGDGPGDLPQDPRVRTVAYTGPPDTGDARTRWLQAGARERNAGARSARGRWFATLRPGDVPAPGFVTTLLSAARDARAEVAHGLLDATTSAGAAVRIGAGAPAQGDFAWGGALIHAGLAGWDLDPLDALLDVDAEWGLCRRMLAAGVRFTAVDAVVGCAAPDRLVAPPLG